MSVPTSSETVATNDSTMQFSVRDAAKLISKALQPSLTPANDVEYRELLAVYRAELKFRQWVDDIICGLDLKLLDITEKGLFVAPSGTSSRFAYKLGDFRSSMSDSEKAALVLAHVAIASVFFPTTESIDNDDQIINPVSVAQLRDALLNLASSLEEQQDKEEHELQMVQSGWELIKGLPIALPKAQKASTNSVVGLIKIALNNLSDAGMVRPHLESEEEAMETYTPTHRYRVQLRELTVRKLLEIARNAGKKNGIEN